MQVNKETVIHVIIVGMVFGFIQFVQAKPVEVILPDGRKAILNDDMTWQPVDGPADLKHRQPVTPSTHSQSILPAAPLPAPADVSSNIVSTQQAKPTLLVPASDVIEMGQQQDVGMYEYGGVTLTVLAPQFVAGQLRLPTRMSNNGSEAVILVSLKLSLYDHNGHLLLNDNQTVWTSIKRMPETYLRSGVEKEGKDIAFTVPPSDKYYLQMEISEVEHR
ncbi:hypothetical protein ABT56_01520 [Photobacterium aquae]|uniref:Uncharacterized protein n=1 Tax=Photobacterium aquae TaxID=1195763 RepID=A0A0J1HB80_9GAMM|nr:DUF3157 family protein [Photobacterium aquae]KLV08913.1 hypothetical protein ABT56_01520 [Photobacterium aquae]